MKPDLALALDRLYAQMLEHKQPYDEPDYDCPACEDSLWIEVEGTEHGQRKVRRCEAELHQKIKREPPHIEAIKFQ